MSIFLRAQVDGMLGCTFLTAVQVRHSTAQYSEVHSTSHVTLGECHMHVKGATWDVGNSGRGDGLAGFVFFPRCVIFRCCVVSAGDRRFVLVLVNRIGGYVGRSAIVGIEAQS